MKFKLEASFQKNQGVIPHLVCGWLESGESRRASPIPEREQGSGVPVLSWGIEGSGMPKTRGGISMMASPGQGSEPS